MSEEATTTTQATDSAPNALATEQSQEVTWENSPIARIYNPDGTPKAEAAKVFDELGKSDIAGHALRNGQDLFTALKTGKDAHSFASQKMEGMIKKPGDDATDEQKAEFNKALGAFTSKEEALANIWPDDLPDGYQKDDALGDLLAEYAAGNPVNTPEALKGLVARYDQFQQERMAEYQKTSIEEAQKAADATKQTLTAEMGSTQAYENFAKEAREFSQSGKFQEFGFEFKTTEDGKLTSDNPVHAAMLSDPASLRWLKFTMEVNKEAKIPSGDPSPVTSEDKEAARRKFYAENTTANGTWKSENAYKDYQKMARQ